MLGLRLQESPLGHARTRSSQTSLNRPSQSGFTSSQHNYLDRMFVGTGHVIQSRLEQTTHDRFTQMEHDMTHRLERMQTLLQDSLREMTRQTQHSTPRREGYGRNFDGQKTALT